MQLRLKVQSHRHKVMHYTTLQRTKRRVVKQNASADALLQTSQNIARSRSLESNREGALFVDPYADLLFSGSVETSTQEHLANVLTTKFLDECVANAVSATNVNRISSGDYKQVVIVGDGLDTRPYRLLWPSGTLLFLVAPKAVHVHAHNALAHAQARVAKGSLLRRVHANVQEGEDFEVKLQECGFRADRLSVWLIQGLRGLQLRMSVDNAINFLATFDLTGSVINFSDEKVTGHEQWQSLEIGHLREDEVLFATQHVKLSLAQMHIYVQHSEAAEELDEDFTDNFS